MERKVVKIQFPSMFLRVKNKNNFSILIFITFLIFLVMVSEVFPINNQKFPMKYLENFRTQSKGISMSKNYLEDAFLTTTQLIAKYRHKAEDHYVTTEDGYILGVHRIPKPGKQPILLQHGLADSSSSFIILGPNKSLGYLLSDNGYDVWLGNTRGNRYSRNHTTLNPENPKFWDFSWHEVGIYDLPAMIDHILNVTEFEQLYYVGHSQGTTTFFVMCSMRPEYNDKIILMQALAPVAYFSHARSPIIPLLKLFLNLLPKKLSGEIFSYGFLRRTPCFQGNSFQQICKEIFFALVGRNPELFNNTLTPVLFTHTPAGSSVKQFRHFTQLLDSGNFLAYDYGDEENLQIYGTMEPPKYNLSAITTPIVLHYGKNDLLADHRDVEKLYKEVSNIRGIYRVTLDRFNHIDFLWAINLTHLVNKKILSIIKRFNDGVLEYIIE